MDDLVIVNEYNLHQFMITQIFQEYTLDKVDTERRARRLMESGSAVTSRGAMKNKKWRGSLRSIGSKTQIKSSSKVSKKSETFN